MIQNPLCSAISMCISRITQSLAAQINLRGQWNTGTKMVIQSAAVFSVLRIYFLHSKIMRTEHCISQQLYVNKIHKNIIMTSQCDRIIEYWKGPIRIIKFNSWPCAGRPKDPTMCLRALAKHFNSGFVLWPHPRKPVSVLNHPLDELQNCLEERALILLILMLQWKFLFFYVWGQNFALSVGCFRLPEL